MKIFKAFLQVQTSRLLCIKRRMIVLECIYIFCSFALRGQSGHAFAAALSVANTIFLASFAGGYFAIFSDGVNKDENMNDFVIASGVNHVLYLGTRMLLPIGLSLLSGATLLILSNTLMLPHLLLILSCSIAWVFISSIMHALFEQTSTCALLSMIVTFVTISPALLLAAVHFLIGTMVIIVFDLLLLGIMLLILHHKTTPLRFL